MMNPTDGPGRGGAAECRKVRLAESRVARVELCSCGVLHLHLGVLSLRLCPDALSELVSTLGQAVAAHAARKANERLEALLSPLAARRGDA